MSKIHSARGMCGENYFNEIFKKYYQKFVYFTPDKTIKPKFLYELLSDE